MPCSTSAAYCDTLCVTQAPVLLHRKWETLVTCCNVHVKVFSTAVRWVARH